MTSTEANLGMEDRTSQSFRRRPSSSASNAGEGGSHPLYYMGLRATEHNGSVGLLDNDSVLD